MLYCRTNGFTEELPWNARTCQRYHCRSEGAPTRTQLCALQYGKDYELMIAVRLSAQCTDARVNQDHARAFCALPDARRLCGGGRRGGRGLCPFLRVLQAQGARHRAGLPDAARRIRRARCPDTMEAAPALPGVGQENGESAAGRSLRQAPGSVVCDTHCIRIANLPGARRAARTRQKVETAAARDSAAGGVALISATGWCCTEEPSASPAARSAGAAASRPTAEAFRDSEQT